MDRVYSKSQNSLDCHVYQGNKLVMHLIYYPGRNYGYPRYHFENFCLQRPDLNLEICRFMKFVNKACANPQLDLNNLQLDFEFSLF